jgi:type I restriction enzyme S subunit
MRQLLSHRRNIVHKLKNPLFLVLPKDPHPNPSPRGRGAKKNTFLLPLYLWERGLGGEGFFNSPKTGEPAVNFPLVAIKNVAKVVTGKTPSKKDEDNFSGEISFITPSELGKGIYVHSSPQTLSEQGAKTIKLVPKNSVMVCCIGSLGKIAIAGKELATNQKINTVIFNENRVYYKYGFYALSRLKPKMEALAPSTTVAIINKSNFEVLEIPLPPLPEQQRIAAILDKADAIRRKRQQAIELADEFLRAVFLEMFGDPVANPKGWEIKTFADIFSRKPQIGTIKPVTNSGDVKVVRVGEIGEKEVFYNKVATTDYDDNDINKYQLAVGDLLLARAIGSESHLGKASLFKEQEQIFIYDSHVMRICFNEKANPDFIYQWLQSDGGRKNFMQQAGRTAVQFNIYHRQLKIRFSYFDDPKIVGHQAA